MFRALWLLCVIMVSALGSSVTALIDGQIPADTLAPNPMAVLLESASFPLAVLERPVAAQGTLPLKPL